MNTDIRELTVDELTMVSGGGKPDFEVRLPGQVTVQLDTKSGMWSVWLAGKEVATEIGRSI
jgi:hypothetical protein